MSISDAKWIWIDQAKTIENQYGCFRKSFTLENVPAEAWCEISADSDFVVMLNGQRVANSQFCDFPDRKTFTRVDVAGRLQKGKNTLCVLAYYCGRDFFSYISGRPGVLLSLKAGRTIVLSDGTWKGRESEAFTNGTVPVVTGALGFTMAYDARKDGAWEKPEFDDSNWPAVKVIEPAVGGFVKTLELRPVAPLAIENEPPVRLATQGDFVRTRCEGSFASIMANDGLIARHEREVFNYDTSAWDGRYTALAKRPGENIRLPDDQWLELTAPDEKRSGRFMILDLGREQVGYLTLRVRANAGTVLDIGFGEHLDEGRVRMKIGHGDFADRYICKDGENEFTYYFRRFGCRYLQVHVSAMTGPVQINYIGVKPVLLALDDRGDFQTHDVLAKRTYAIAKRTLHLCMHDHYVDCPWREQGLYGFDSRNQALYGYYAFGNYEYAETSLDLLGRGLRSDGILEMCAPARIPGAIIPSFSLHWICAVADHVLFTGRTTLFDRHASTIERILRRTMEKKDASRGLYYFPTGEGYWQFYEWVDGLAGKDPAFPEEGRLDAPHNLILIDALGRYAKVLDQVGRSEQANDVRQTRQSLVEAVVNQFWNDQQGAMASFLVDGRQKHYADFIQAIALYENILDADRERRVLENMARKALFPTTLSPYLYLLPALMTRTAETRKRIAQVMSENWDPMVFQGATSFWETQLGGDDFNFAGSLCHGWSALPVYFYQAWVLGVRPTSPGFKTFVINPWPDRFFKASGKIPTPSGTIKIEWTRRDDGLVVTATGPDDLAPALQAYPEFPILSATYNQRRI